MSYIPHTPLTYTNWRHALDYHAYNVMNRDTTYHYSPIPDEGSIHETGPLSHSFYDNNIDWTDTDPKPDYVQDLLPIMDIALEWLIENNKESFENYTRDYVLNDHTGLMSASNQLATSLQDIADIQEVTGSQQSPITNAPTDAVTNLSIIGTLLGTLTGEVNASNTKQNSIATIVNAILTALRNHGLIDT